VLLRLVLASHLDEKDKDFLVKKDKRVKSLDFVSNLIIWSSKIIFCTAYYIIYRVEFNMSIEMSKLLKIAEDNLRIV
jgi:hypothetical protein